MSDGYRFHRNGGGVKPPLERRKVKVIVKSIFVPNGSIPSLRVPDRTLAVYENVSKVTSEGEYFKIYSETGENEQWVRYLTDLEVTE